MRILLDMDGVLVDFVGGALAVHGISRTELESRWPIGTYDIVKPMGLTAEEFWKPINEKGKDFWVELEPMPWIDELVNLVESLTDDWHIASSPSRSAQSYAGKVLWLKWYFGELFDRFVLTPHKHIFACNSAVLIDDQEENVNRFIGAAGRGILFPARWNSLYLHRHDPVKYISTILEEQCK